MAAETLRKYVKRYTHLDFAVDALKKKGFPYQKHPLGRTRTIRNSLNYIASTLLRNQSMRCVALWEPRNTIIGGSSLLARKVFA